MAQHEVEIKDSIGKAVALQVTVPPVGDSTWRVKYEHFLRLQEGLASRGPGGPTSAGDWLACYGGKEIDDDLLVLHLDDFFTGAQVNQSGRGKLYNHDNLLMMPGPLTWRVRSTV